MRNVYFFFLSSYILLDVVYNEKCGYESCPVGKPGMLNVHIICHTHDDVGWVRTVDEYYDGDGGSYLVTVKGILNSVVKELPRRSDRKFIYVETAFFWHWWQEQNATTKAKVKNLVSSGQLEFVGGGWVMNDEGAVHYSDTIDHMTLGLRRLRKLFGRCGVPKVIWQIDPFGHSREQASLFNQMGFDGLFLGRIHYQDKAFRMKHKNMEFLWNTSASLGKQSLLFTGILYNEYSAPKGFCFDYVCGESVGTYNVETKAKNFLSLVQKQAKSYATNNVMVTMGGDFTYFHAETWFESIDRLMKYINSLQKKGSKVNVFYSTPSCYLNALQKSRKKTWVTKTDDFFPYGSSPVTYWTGYFTSRPSFKGYVREASRTLQVCRQLQFLSREIANGKIIRKDLEELKEALGVAQHHDAVSGTAKQYVTNDYIQHLSGGVKKCQQIISDAYKSLMPMKYLALGNNGLDETFCDALNVSFCKITEESQQFIVTVYNSFGHDVNHTIRVPVKDGEFEVTAPNGNNIENQVVPLSTPILSLTEREESTSTHALLFRTTLPPLGIQRFSVKRIHDEKTSFIEEPITDSNNEMIVISNELFTLHFNRTDGLLRKIVDETEHFSISLSQNFYYYRSQKNVYSDDKPQASGAYIFRPIGKSVRIASRATIKIVKGQIVDEIHQIFNEWISQVIRLPKHEKYVEFEWLVGPIPVKDSMGKEVISFFQSDLETNETFYTDANGREILQRRRNYQPTWNLNVTEPIAGNYYPVNSRIFIRDEMKDIQVTLLTDRSVGGSSLKDGSMEIMLHRRTLHDDGKGVNEPLNELGYDKQGLVVRGRTLLLIDKIADSARRHRELSQKLFMEPMISFQKISKNMKYNPQNEIRELTGIKQALPPNIHLLTLEVLREPYVLLRLEHFYENLEDLEMSRKARVNLEIFFKRSTITSVRETTLAANQLIDENERLPWSGEEEIFHSGEHESCNTIDKGPHGFVVSLAPMQIRTFIIELKMPYDY